MFKKIMVVFVFMFLVLSIYFAIIHLIVYGRNYDAAITNFNIILNKPRCIGSFLTIDRLKNKYSSEIYKWIYAKKIDPATYSGTKGKNLSVPDYIWKGLFSKDMDAKSINLRLSCEFIMVHANDPFNIHYYYKYKRSSLFFGGIGDRKIEVFIKVNNGEVSRVYSRVYWGY